MRTPASVGLPEDKFPSWRKGQDRALRDLLFSEDRFNLLCIPTGGGKTAVYMGYAGVDDGRVLVLTATRALQDQIAAEFDSMGLADMRGRQNYDCDIDTEVTAADAVCTAGVFCERMKGRGGPCGYYDKLRAATKGRIVVTNYRFWLHAEESGALGNFNTIVMDECLPPGTDVGGRRLEEIRVGDTVPSFDPTTHEMLALPVTGRTVSRASRLFRLSFGGRILVCTATHPILTVEGWQFAGDLLIGDLVLCSPHETNLLSADGDGDVLMVQDEAGDFDWPEAVSFLSTDRQDLLFDRVRPSLCEDEAETTNSGYPQDALRTHEGSEPDAISAGQSKDADDSPCDGLEAGDTGRERQAAADSGSPTGISARVEHGRSGIVGEKETGLPDELQDRHRGADSESGNRGRWYVSPQSKTSRPEKGTCLVPVRLDDLEVLESGSDGTFGGLCPDGLVYNLEVDGSHAYIAEGLAVHNSHKAPDEISDFAAVEITGGELRRFGIRLPPGGVAAKNPSRWGSLALEIIDRKMAGTKEVEKRKALRNLQRRLARLCRLSNEEWLGSTPRRDVWRWDLVDPGALAEDLLFRGAKRIILASASVRRKTLQLLGVESKVKVLEQESTFPVRRRPVYYWPVARVGRKMTGGDRTVLHEAIDEFIEPRLDRKGIVHSVSYEFAREIWQRSKHRDRMLLHDRHDDTPRLLRKFKLAPPGTVLVSPAVGTGNDFPFEACEYQVIPKMPFPSLGSPLVRARATHDPDYSFYVTMQALVQSVGRGMRDAEDQCETVILDGNFGWVRARYWDFGPRWFHAGIKTVSKNDTPPMPPPPLKPRC